MYSNTDVIKLIGQKKQTRYLIWHRVLELRYEFADCVDNFAEQSGRSDNGDCLRFKRTACHVCRKAIHMSIQATVRRAFPFRINLSCTNATNFHNSSIVLVLVSLRPPNQKF
jgi:hypothetical protein